MNTEAPEAGLEEFVPEFLEDRQAEYAQMKGFLTDSKYEDLRKMAHKWKGFCDPYGFGGLTSLSKNLEIQAEEKKGAACESILNEIAMYLDKKRKHLQG